MAAWAIVLIIFLFIVAITIGILNGITASNNQVLARRQILLPFSSTIDPVSGEPSPFVNIDKTPQIKCPTGSKINIIGAFFDVFDPYGECNVSVHDVDPFLAFMCSPEVDSGKKRCTTAQDCPYANVAGNSPANPFMCTPNGTCQLKEQATGSSTQCQAGLTLTQIGGKYYCIDKDICGVNISGAPGTGVPNPICSPGGVGRCAMRDASATVGAKCNGRTTCEDLSMEDFKDMPCPNLKISSSTDFQCITGYSDGLYGKVPNWIGGSKRSGYCGLPYLPGYKGGLPTDSVKNGEDGAASSNIGYAMHGIYTCVPDKE